MNHISNRNIFLFEEMVKGIQAAYEAAGIAVAIVNSEGETEYQNFFGYRDAEEKLPINENTIFGLASVSKSYVALSIMQLAEQGKLSLEDPVSKYIPEFKNENQDTVKILHFLSHSAGFYPLHRTTIREVMGEDVPASCDAEEDLTYSEEMALKGTEIVAKQLDAQTKENGLIGKPGQYMSYCNDGFGLLSEIVRRVGGEPSFAEYVSKNILKPLKMGRTGADYVRPSVVENATTLYKHVKGTRIALKDYYDRAFVLPGAGAMKSTLADMKHYATMYLNYGKFCGERILSKEGIRQMTFPRIEYRPGVNYCYGLSTKQMGDLTIVEHGGSLTGISSNLSWSYDAGCAVIVLCNTTGVPVSEIADAAMKLYHGVDLFTGRTKYSEDPWKESVQKAAVGTYYSAEENKVEILFEGDELCVLVNGVKAKFSMVTETVGLLHAPYKDGTLKLFTNEEEEVFAVGYGGRMIPRVKNIG